VIKGVIHRYGAPAYGSPPYGGGPPPGNGYNRGPIQDATPGYPGAMAANAGSSSWNPRMGPPPTGGYAPPTTPYTPPAAPYTSPTAPHAPPPVNNGYPGAPGGNWVGDQSHGGAFYSAPMGQPRELLLEVNLVYIE
jgi:hypothetical protein